MTMIGLFYWKAGITHEKVMECLAKRMQFQEPEGANMLFEYWPGGVGDKTPAVVAGYDMTDLAPMMEVELIWGEYFDIMMLPAIKADDGIKMSADVMQHIGAMA